MEEEDEDYEVPISTATMNSGSLNDTLRWLVSSVDDIRNRMTLMDQRLFLLVTNGAAFHRVQNIGGPRMPTFPMLRESNALVSAEKEHWVRFYSRERGIKIIIDFASLFHSSNPPFWTPIPCQALGADL